MAVTVKRRTRKTLRRFEAEHPDSRSVALIIVFDLDDYELVKAATPYEYGYHVLQEFDLAERDIELRG